MGVPPAKLHEKPLDVAAGSDPSRDRKGAISAAKKFAIRERFFDSTSTSGARNLEGTLVDQSCYTTHSQNKETTTNQGVTTTVETT